MAASRAIPLGESKVACVPNMEVRMRRVVHREIGGSKRRRRATTSSKRFSAASAGGVGFGRLLSQLFSASSSLERSRSRVGSR